MREVYAKKGDKYLSGTHVGKTLSSAGFADIKIREVNILVGQWGKGVIL
jgi:hypothetical protein